MTCICAHMLIHTCINTCTHACSHNTQAHACILTRVNTYKRHMCTYTHIYLPEVSLVFKIILRGSTCIKRCFVHNLSVKG